VIELGIPYSDFPLADGSGDQGRGRPLPSPLAPPRCRVERWPACAGRLTNPWWCWSTTPPLPKLAWTASVTSRRRGAHAWWCPDFSDSEEDRAAIHRSPPRRIRSVLAGGPHKPAARHGQDRRANAVHLSGSVSPGYGRCPSTEERVAGFGEPTHRPLGHTGGRPGFRGIPATIEPARLQSNGGLMGASLAVPSSTEMAAASAWLAMIQRSLPAGFCATRSAFGTAEPIPTSVTRVPLRVSLSNRICLSRSCERNKQPSSTC